MHQDSRVGFEFDLGLSGEPRCQWLGACPRKFISPPRMFRSQRLRFRTARRSNSVARCARGEISISARRRVEKPPIDCIALSNLCVDVVVPMDKLPSNDPAMRASLLQSLTANPPSQSSWEIGGNGNFLIAASRLGLSVKSVGHVGEDAYGVFMSSELRQEGVAENAAIATWSGQAASLGPKLDQTLVCFVLVDPDHNHAFCSRQVKNGPFDQGRRPFKSLSSSGPDPPHTGDSD